jgi:hypothetical protein
MRPNFYAQPLNWRSYGYFTQPTPADDPQRGAEPNATQWTLLEAIIQQAKTGDFRNVTDLLGIVRRADDDGVLRGKACEALGDLGHVREFKSILEELDSLTHPERAIAYCGALRDWGRLSVIPVLLHQYDIYKPFDIAEKIPLYVSSILEKEWGELAQHPSIAQLDEYAAQVLSRYHELKESFASDDVLVQNGAKFGVVPFARQILGHLTDSYFDVTFQPYFRRRFEALTGIDCSPFFQDGVFQPLAAAAIVEEFLEGRTAPKYEVGVRYFFGHRIPD